MQELDRLSPAAYEHRAKTPIILVLDNIRSALNVGSAFRTADAFALQRIVLCGISARPPHREILKTALGATDTVEWTYAENTADAVSELRQQGATVLAVEQTTDSRPLQEFALQPSVDRPLALLFGNEVKGVDEAALQLVDGAIEVPQYGTKHSLNVSVCLGIVVWELFRRWKFDHPDTV